MIVFVYGTTAELIKVAPVYQRLVDRGDRPELWCTGQHTEDLELVAERLGLPEPDVILAEGRAGRSLARVADVPVWASAVARYVVRHRRQLESRLWSDSRPPIVLVHGDTLTTVIGAALGRWLGATVGHIEAGLRTNTLFDPFPEEIDRRVAARLAHVHFTPGIDKFSNIWARRGLEVDTMANTVFDSLRMVPPAAPGGEISALPPTYGLVSLHRFELIRNAERFTAVLKTLHKLAGKVPLYVVTDAQCSARLTELDLDELFDGERMIRLEKLPYYDFISLLRGAEFVVTDSGGLQEECAYLSIPCLVHRTTTERREGIGANVVLSMYDLDVLERFIGDPARYTSTEPPNFVSPSDIIISHLVRAGHASSCDSRPNADLAVIVPAFDESETIKPALENLVRGLEAGRSNYEVIVVASDSRGDSTATEAERVDSERVRVLRYSANAGRSFAFKFAFAHTGAPIVVYSEPTMLVAPENITAAVDRLDSTGAAVVAGSKTHAISDVAMTRGRRIQTSLFSAVVRRLFGVPVRDAQLGLKAFRREVLSEILPYTHSTGFGFGVELLATAADLGYRVEESPVELPGRMKAIRNPLWLLAALGGSLKLLVLRIQLAVDRQVQSSTHRGTDQRPGPTRYLSRDQSPAPPTT